VINDNFLDYNYHLSFIILTMFFKEKINLQIVLTFLIKLFLFILPWQTIWIYREIFIKGFKLESGTLGFYGTEILLWIIVFLFIIFFWQKRKFQISNFKFQISQDRLFVFSILLFIVYCLLSSLWALDSDLAWQQGLRIMEMFLLFFVLYLGPLNFKDIVKWFLLGSILPVFLGIYQFIWQVAPAWKWLGLAGHVGWEGGASIISGETLGRVLRSYGSFSHPNIFGGYLVIAILFLLLISDFFPFRRANRFKNKKFSIFNFQFLIFLFIFYCLLLTALFFTFSRSAILALGIVLLIYYFVKKIVLKDYIKKIIITLLPILILIIFLIPVLAVRVSGDSVYEARSIEERLTGISEAREVVKNNLWFGVGAGNYTLTTYNINPNLEGWQYQPVHNVFVLFVVELGLVGVGLFLLIIISFLNLKNKEKGVKSKSGELLLYSLFFILYSLLGTFDHYLYSSYVGLMFSGVYWTIISKYHTQSLPS